MNAFFVVNCEIVNCENSTYRNGGVFSYYIYLDHFFKIGELPVRSQVYLSSYLQKEVVQKKMSMTENLHYFFVLRNFSTTPKYHLHGSVLLLLLNTVRLS